MIDFCNGREKISITEITSKFLEKFEAYLLTKRTMKRKNQFGKTVTITRKGLAPVSIINYMTDIRTVFNDAMDEFNDVSIHAPARGATAVVANPQYLLKVSIHAPARGATAMAEGSIKRIWSFNPRTREGCDAA